MVLVSMTVKFAQKSSSLFVKAFQTTSVTHSPSEPAQVFQAAFTSQYFRHPVARGVRKQKLHLGRAEAEETVR